MLKIKNITEKFILLIAVALAITALYFSFQSNYILTYNDAASHMNIARRVMDSLTPGFAQIGTVWLPLPHVLMLPFVWNDFLWHTGFAGSIVSMIAYIVSAVFIYKLILLLTKSRFGSVIGTFVLLLNPNLLYMQTTPMTEPLLLASIILSIYFLAKYLQTNILNDLILCSGFISTATLIRYDGWFLFAMLCVLLPLWIGILYGKKRAESTLILFLVAGGFGIFLWFLWNLVIFGDALYFITGPYSAAAQQKVLASVGQLPTKGNIFVAMFYYMWAVIDNNGIVLVITAALGTLFVPFFLKPRRQILVLIALLSPIIFNVIALYVGQSAMNVPEAPSNPGIFNIRYGMMALPAIAIIIGILTANKYLRIFTILLLCAQSFLFFKQGLPITLVDGISGLENTYYTVEAGKWLAEHYKGGLILTSLASHDAFVARTGIPMKNYIHEGTKPYWQNALSNPSKDIKYIALLSFPPDVVYKSLQYNPTFKKAYIPVHSYKTFTIYERKK